MRWQLHPHFLFNALNTVSTLVIRGAALEAEDAIAQISRYLRSALAQRADTMVTLAQELAVVQQYVQIEMLRFGDALRVEQRAAQDALGVRIPSLILQPLVENAIRYGGPSASRQDAIVIAGIVQGARLILSVINPGYAEGERTDDGAVNGAVKGVVNSAVNGADARPDGFGLRYVQQRLRLFYGDDATLTLAQTAAHTTVTIDLPIARATPKS